MVRIIVTGGEEYESGVPTDSVVIAETELADFVLFGWPESFTPTCGIVVSFFFFGLLVGF